MQATILPKDGATPQEQARLRDYTKADIKPTLINSQLAHVDNVLRIQSQITKEPIEKLRKQFMETFNKEGMPSDNATKAFATAAAQPATQPVSGQAANKKTNLGVGDVYNGYRFNGGDPSVESSWSKQ